MTTDHPFSLTDAQLEMLTDAAALLPPAGRASFLQSVANVVGAAPSDAELRAAITLVLEDRGGVFARRRAGEPAHQTP